MKPSERRARAFVKQVVNAAECGDCQACCHAVAVHEIGKGEYTTCEHQCPSGCAIYNRRPESCRSYYCFWRMSHAMSSVQKQGWMSTSVTNRPDQLRVIFDMESGKGDGGKGKPYIRCWQLDSPTQVLDDPIVRKVAYDIAVKCDVPLLAYYENEQRSVHLIKRLSHWRLAFLSHPQGYPVFDLTPDPLSFEKRHLVNTLRGLYG